VKSFVFKPKRLKVMGEFEDEYSDGGVFATVTQYLSSNEKPTDEQDNPLLYWRNRKYLVLTSLARTCEALWCSG